jgi:6,7-dimethyl-8-ribityllumazine synthase
MAKIVQGELRVGAHRYAIIAGRFNEIITRRLIDGAVDCLTRHGATEDQYTIYMCPGSFEIPLVAARVLDTKKFDAVICLGAIIRGETPHNSFIAAEVTKGISTLSLETRTPVTLGVLTTDNLEQALERAGLKHGNKGWEAALTAIEMVNLIYAMES